MKFILIPDSFKGTLSSEQICEIAKEKVEKAFSGRRDRVCSGSGRWRRIRRCISDSSWRQ